MMVTQPRWPIIRSEGWFALALVARNPLGSTMTETLLQNAEVFNAVEETIGDQNRAASSPTLVQGQAGMGSAQVSADIAIDASSAAQQRFEPAREMKTKDRENVMVLLSELLKNRVRHQHRFPCYCFLQSPQNPLVMAVGL